MKLQPAVKKEMLHIALGTGIGAVVMLAIFALLGRFDLSVLLAGVGGSVIAIINFLLLGLTVQRVAAQQDEMRGRKIMQASYSTRMLVMLLWIILAVALPVLNWVAAAVPLLFPRLTIGVMQLTGYYKKSEPAPQGAEQTKEE